MRLHRGRTAAAVTAAWVVLAGCRFPDQLPPNATPTCAADADCPSGMRCNSRAGRCFSRTPAEELPPGIVTRLIAPLSGNQEAQFNLQFRVSEPLAVEPLIHLVASDGRELQGVQRVENQPEREFFYRFSAQADPMAVEGPVLVLVDLTDAVGNTAERVLVGSFTLDFTPPQVSDSPAPSVTFSPAPDNPSSTVEAVTRGTTVLLAFTTSEPLVDVAVASSTPLLTFGLVSGQGTSFTFEARVDADAGVADELVGLTVLGHDSASNALDASIALASPLRLDTAPPPLPLADAGVRYVRRPWGVTDGGPPTSFWLEAPVGAFEPRSWVVARDLGGSQVLARSRATAEGALEPLLLGPVDRPLVELAVVDEAGNSSAFTTPHQVRLIASLEGHVPGSSFPNPNRAESWPSARPAAFSAAGVEALSQFNCTGLCATSGPSWKRRRTSPPSCGVLASHRWTGEVFQVGDRQLNVWSGSDWALRRSVDDPGGCYAAAWDEARGALVATCGGSTFERSASGQWAQTSGPVGRLVWFGSVGQVVGWEGALKGWNGRQWSELPGGSPANMISLATDGDDALVALDSSGRTWRYRQGAWALASDAGVANPTACTLVTEPTQKRPWLLWVEPDGGTGIGQWQGNGWSKVPLSNGISTVCGASAEPAAEAVLVVDSDGGTWRHFADGGVTLALQSVRVGPGPVARHAAAFDPDAGEVELVVGRASSTELWSWNGVRFAKGPSLVGAREQAAFTEEPARGAMVLYGGFSGTTALDELWEYRAATGWAQRVVTGGIARGAAAMTFCPQLQGLLLQGGRSSSGTSTEPGTHVAKDVYLLPSTGSGWSSAYALTSPSAFHSAWYNPAKGVCQLGFGRSNGGAYLNSNAAVLPDAGFMLTYFSTGQLERDAFAGGVTIDGSGALLSFGGYAPVAGAASDNLAVINDLSPGNSRSLSSLTLVDPEGDGNPSPRLEHTFSADQRRGVVVAYGGRRVPDAGAVTDELWELQASGQQPRVVFFVELQGVDTRAFALSKVRVIGQADSHAADAGVFARLFAGRWVDVARLPTGGFDFEVQDAALLDDAWRAQSALALELATEARHQVDAPAKVSVGRLELWLDYHLP